jgi:hypothetical protein
MWRNAEAKEIQPQFAMVFRPFSRWNRELEAKVLDREAGLRWNSSIQVQLLCN